MDMKDYTALLVERLEAAYPLAECSLDYDEAWKLLFAVRLAAQCTDKRVNEVTPLLYGAYPTLEALAEADVEAVAEIVRPCGFFRTKARDIVLSAQMLVSDFGGRVPDDMESLLQLPGVGRKTANLILGDVYRQPSAVVVDTHCIRLTGRMGLVTTKDPVKIEMALRELLPPEKSNDFCHRLVLHGRAVCPARGAKCGECNCSDVCKKVGV